MSDFEFRIYQAKDEVAAPGATEDLGMLSGELVRPPTDQRKTLNRH